MKVRATVFACVILLVSGVGWSQSNRLGDVAGSIKLNPDAIVEKEGYVEEDPRAAVKADRKLFSAALDDCTAIADHLGQLVEEARLTVMYPDDDLPGRLTAASLDLESQIQNLYLLRLTDSFAEVVETARQAADDCAAASVSVREELDRMGVAFTEAIEKVTLCRQDLHTTKTRLSAAENPNGAGVVNPVAATSAASDQAVPLSDEEIVAGRCEADRAKGTEAYDACREAQFQAEAAMASRTADNEMLVESVFNGIRGICLELHPKDFALRNNCELDKMTAARLEQE